MLKTVFTDRRIWLLGLILVSVWLVTRLLIPADSGFRWVIYCGYWITLLLVVQFVWSVWPVVSERWKQASLGRFDTWVLIGILAVTGVWVAHERPGYKILADELLLSGTAMGLHYERKAAVPNRATDVQGAFLILDRSLDKRPLLFPFLVATVHDLTGYRPPNAFYLNIGLSAGFLWLVYLIGWGLGRSRWAGIAAGLLFAGLPLLAQQATGGGFELLNLFLIAVFALLVVNYLERPEPRRLEALIFAALLLASTRYESVVFLVPAALAAAIGWWRSGRLILSWPLIWSPLFLSPLLLQNRLFSEHTQVWQMSGQVGVNEPFGFQYLSQNLGHAMAFFFDFSGYLLNSPILSLLGLMCLPFLGLWIVRVFRKGADADGRELAWALLGTSLFGITAVYMLYFWGKFDDPVISRLSLPVHLLMVMAVVLVGSLSFKTARGWKMVALIAVGGFFFQSLPVMARQAYRTNYAPGVAMEIRGDFLVGLADRNVLFVDNDAFFWILHKIPSSPVKQVMLRKEGLIYHLKNHSFQAMYVFQNVRVNDTTGAKVVDAVDDLGPDFVLEPVMEKRVQTLLFARISRIAAIKEGGTTVVQPRAFVEAQPEKRSVEELEKGRSIYLENWVKQLP